MTIAVKSTKPKAARLPVGIYAVGVKRGLRQALTRMLGQGRNLALSGAADTPREAASAILRLQPSLVLIQLDRPGKPELDLIRQVVSNGKTRVLAVATRCDPTVANKVLRAGADGYILEDEGPEEIFQAACDVLGGELYISEDVLAVLPKRTASDWHYRRGRTISFGHLGGRRISVRKTATTPNPYSAESVRSE